MSQTWSLVFKAVYLGVLGIFVFSSLGFCCYSAFIVWQEKDAASFVKTIGRVISTRIDKHDSDYQSVMPPYYYVVVTYHYSAEGQEYEQSALDQSKLPTRAKAESFASDNYPKGSKTTVLYNQHNPGYSRLSESNERISLLGGAIVFFFIGLFGVVMGVGWIANELSQKD